MEKLAGDASFRRYFRVVQAAKSYVLMDAPPDREDVTPFLDVRSWLSGADVRVPVLLAEDQQRGFLLLEDFGDVTWAASLDDASLAAVSLDEMFDDAWSQLRLLQGSSPTLSLPLFDISRMQRECDLYLDWYLPKVAEKTPSENERVAFHAAMRPLLEEIDRLPKVPVHLDFHSRNLMIATGGLPLGVIDFQDAVMGPATYDPASLLYDCYQNYTEEMRRRQSRRFFEALPEPIASTFEDFEAWHRALRLTALQRHIKAIGIFARLAHRDHKQQFLDEIPLTRQHLIEEVSALNLDVSCVSLLMMAPAEQEDAVA